MRIDKLFLLRFMRSYYRVTKRVDRDFYAVSFAIPVFAVFIDAAVRGREFLFYSIQRGLRRRVEPFHELFE